MSRSLELDPRPVARLRGAGRCIAYARELLERLGAVVSSEGDADDPSLPLIVDGALAPQDPARPGGGDVVRLWDFQVGLKGTGLQASMVSGVSCVIGMPGRPPQALPSDVPEKWCALLGVSIALSLGVSPGGEERGAGTGRVFDVATADVLRAFADQNFANHKSFPESWSRNGRITPNHGGIYPQGFFPCKDGYLAIVGRSRADWQLILEVLGGPDWAQGDLLDPVLLASHPERVDALFERELARFTRDELLDAAIRVGATMAPVYSLAEARQKNLVPGDLFDGPRGFRLPFWFDHPTRRA